MDQLKHPHRDQAAHAKKLLARAKKRGMEDPSIAAGMRPCVELSTRAATKTDLSVGKSRIGGTPDLPRGTRWPTGKRGPMTFVAQLDLAAIAPFDPRGLLPKRGMLAFFVGELDQGAVIYSEDLKTLVPAKVPAGVKFGGAPAPTFPACGVRLRGAVSLPLEIADDKGRWFDVFDGHREAPHRVLGHPFGEPEGMDDDEVVLLALGSDEACGMEWGDARTLYFCIHPTSLAGGAWSRVRVVSGA